MGKGGGGDASQSGMFAAMASAQAADKAYQLGEQQLQWSKDVWNQMQPLVTQSEQAQLDVSQQEAKSLEQMRAESQQQWQQYQDVYAPVETKLAAEAQNWASPENQALVRGQAMGDIAQAGVAGINTAAETLRGYGVDPSSGKYRSLYTSAQPMLSAGEAAAGTSASQTLKQQQLALEGQVVNTGRGLVNSTGTLTQSGTGAGNAGAGAASGAGTTGFSNLSTGSNAMTAPTAWFNSGAQNMGVYVNAVNGYNDALAKQQEAAASEAGGLGSAAGGVAGLLMKFADKGGPITRGYVDGGMVDPTFTPPQGGGDFGRPGIPPVPLGATTGGTVPVHASPSYGAATDDVPAMLTAHEFVVPKDVAMWVGHKALAQQIDKARKEQQQFSQRDDIGGEPVAAIPQRPNFVSRPTG